MSTPVGTPVVNLTFPYTYSFHMQWISNTTISVQAGVCRDITNTIDMNLGDEFGDENDTIVNAAVNGANGLDVGSLANNTWYSLFVIGDSRNIMETSLLLSTSITNPLLPLGYDSIRRIGWALTDGSAHIKKFYQAGSGGREYYQWDVPISVLSGGSATSFTEVSLALAAPPQATPVWLNLTYTPASAANTASIRPHGSSASAGSTPIVLKNCAAAAQSFPTTRIAPLSETPSIDYVVTSSDALSISVVGFEDYYD